MLNRSGSARLRPGWQRLTSSRDLGVYHLALSPPRNAAQEPLVGPPGGLGRGCRNGSDWERGWRVGR